MNKIMKPTTVMVEELKRDLATVINASTLPPFIVEPILQELLGEAKVAKQRQYEIDKSRYEQALASEDLEENEDDNSNQTVDKGNEES